MPLQCEDLGSGNHADGDGLYLQVFAVSLPTSFVVGSIPPLSASTPARKCPPEPLVLPMVGRALWVEFNGTRRTRKARKCRLFWGLVEPGGTRWSTRYGDGVRQGRLK